MIRVFLLSLFSFIALILIARSLPPPSAVEGQPAGGAAGAALDPSAPFARWDGTWEGTFRTYAADGSLEEAIQVRQEYTTLSDAEQEVVILDHLPDGSWRRSRGRNTRHADGRLECVVWDESGAMKRLAGRLQGRAILWHRADASSGLSETFREEVVSDAVGDLYTIDGAGLYGAEAPRLLLFEGRYRRIAAAP